MHLEGKKLKTITSKQCKNCFKVKPLGQFPFSNRLKGWYASNCKACTTEIQSHRRLVKRANTNPHEYLECVDCGYIQKINHSKKDQPCRKCGGYLLEAYENE